VARVELSAVALQDLERLVITHSLPPDTRLRLKRSLPILGEFPLVGRELSWAWRGMRFILGPWRWLLIVYLYDNAEDRVLVLTIQDARSSAAATFPSSPQEHRSSPPV
jgi:hypothetical protein